MRTTAYGRRNRTRRAAATVLATVLAGGTVLLAAPAALAADAVPDVPTVKVKADAPAVIGLAGQPVEFTETVTNTSSMDSGFHLFLNAVTGAGLPLTDGIAIDYRDPADGAWKSLPLTDVEGSAFHGALPYTLEIPAHRSAKVQLRIGLPMGRPHHGASNGGIQSLALESSVAIGAHGAPADQVTDTIKVDGLTTGLSRVPATAVAGGAPIEFDAVLKNPTASNYVNVANVLGIDPHATVQVRKGNGAWTALKPVQGGGVDDGLGVYLEGRDSSIGANSTTTLRVRMSFDAATPLGPVTVNPCVFVNENPERPFSGTTMCAQRATVKIVAPDASASKEQPPVKEAPVKEAPVKGASTGKGAPAVQAVPAVKGASTRKDAPAGQAAAPAAPAPAAAPTAPAATAEATVAAPAPAPVLAAAGTPAPVAPAPATVELASTGSSEQTPSYAAAGVALLAVGGGTAYWVARRRRA
ncbi:LAETG motif-containing sortase-dependent surface protein [Kitasatospora sp. NPDC057965]|uniref:LAETG motif-containing sortase-dependent surface protein n=1 Tax=Kitasatospora sp. NPDC057965 TaxID=3346291 RepID=UPI0036DD3AB2